MFHNCFLYKPCTVFIEILHLGIIRIYLITARFVFFLQDLLVPLDHLVLQVREDSKALPVHQDQRDLLDSLEHLGEMVNQETQALLA